MEEAELQTQQAEHRMALLRRLRPVGLVLLGASVATLLLVRAARPPITLDPSLAVGPALTQLPPAGIAPGVPAPDFALPDLEGRSWRLSELRGRPVLLNFWASWCPPCREEMPHLVAAYRRNEAEGFVLLGMNLTHLETGEEDARDFAVEFGVPFPVLLDRNGTVAQAYRVTGIPTSVFIDRQGIVRHVHLGPMTEALVESKLRELR